MKNNIVKLLASDLVSNYRISVDTGISQSTLSDLANGKAELGNMKLDHALILNEYYIKLEEEKEMKTWVRGLHFVQEVEFDGDLHEFVVVNGKDEEVARITPADLEQQEQIIADLDAGEDINGWEDGNGNTISI